MSRTVLFMVWGYGYGRLARCLALGRAFDRQGWRVAVALNQEDQAPLVEQWGFEPLPYPADLVPADIWRHWAETDFIRRSVALDLEIIEKVQPDLVVHDGRMSALIAAGVAGTPATGLLAQAALPGMCYPGKREIEAIWSDAAPAFSSVLSERFGAPGIRDIRSMFLAAPAVVPSIPEVDPLPPGFAGDDVHYIGPVTALTPMTAPESGPPPAGPRDRLFFYRTLNDSARLEEFAQVFGDLAERVSIATGEETYAERLRGAFVGAQFDVRPLWDMAWLGPRTGAAVIHGGHGSCLTSLQAGMPTVVLADGSPERRLNAHRLADLGVAVCVEEESDAPWDWASHGRPATDLAWGRIREAVDEVLASTSMASSAQAWRERLAGCSLEAAVSVMTSVARPPRFDELE